MSDSLKAAKIVLFMGAGAGIVGIVKTIPSLSLEKLSIVASLGKISGTLAGFSAPWLLPALGIFTLIGTDWQKKRDFSGWNSNGFFSGSVETGEVIPGNTELAAWLATYWMLVYPMVMFYYEYIRFPFTKALVSLLGSDNFAITVLDRLAEFSPIVIAVIVARKIWHSDSTFCKVIILVWMSLISVAAVNMVVYCGFYLMQPK
jgi:hypothetical protein